MAARSPSAQNQVGRVDRGRCGRPAVLSRWTVRARLDSPGSLATAGALSPSPRAQPDVAGSLRRQVVRSVSGQDGPGPYAAASRRK